MFVNKGTVKYCLKSQQVILKDGDFILANSGDLHKLENNDVISDIYMMVIKAEAINQVICMDKIYSAYFPSEKMQNSEDYKSIPLILQQLLREYTNVYEFKENTILSLVHLLFYYILRCYPSAQPRKHAN